MGKIPPMSPFPQIALLAALLLVATPFGSHGLADLVRVDEDKPVTGLFILYSTGIGKMALDSLNNQDTVPNSPFTRVLLDRLGEPGGLDRLAKTVRKEVAAATSAVGTPQIPAYYFDGDSENFEMAAPDPARKRVALVVGIADYAHLAKLSTPRDDAEAVAKKLESLGFTVTKALDAKRSDLTAKLDELSARLGDQDVAILYFAGHGAHVGGVDYLLPSDLAISDDEGAELTAGSIGLDAVVDKLSGGRDGNTIIIIDAARDNPFKAKPSR
jgi:hypothetical protein